MLWLRNHPGRTVGERDIAEIFATAYGRSATQGNAVSAYKKTGIEPFNPGVFSDEDFVAADVTDNTVSSSDVIISVHVSSLNMEQVDAAVPTNHPDAVDHTADHASRSNTEQLDTIVQIEQPYTDSNEVAGPVTVESNADDHQTVSKQTSLSNVEQADSAMLFNLACAVDPVSDHASLSEIDQLDITLPTEQPDANVVQVPDLVGVESHAGVQCAFTSFDILIPAPKLGQRQTTRKRKVAHAMIVTSSPYKSELRQNKEAKKKKPLFCKEQLLREDGSSSRCAQRVVQNFKGNRKNKRSQSKKKEKAASSSSTTSDDHTPCSTCCKRHLIRR